MLRLSPPVPALVPDWVAVKVMTALEIVAAT
jgi:hypothetical protein